MLGMKFIQGLMQFVHLYVSQEVSWLSKGAEILSEYRSSIRVGVPYMFSAAHHLLRDRNNYLKNVQ